MLLTDYFETELLVHVLTIEIRNLSWYSWPGLKFCGEDHCANLFSHHAFEALLLYE